ncbi:hypothetical protein [uncultured Gilliamella sp.]|uniref:hypothetical protein n=1 Tax=uncultured Gilliamella sp. TaxID=1193505 RepID=UPI0025DD552C|nr:hypothetical protein [uncultured Gilliamella sp.]
MFQKFVKWGVIVNIFLFFSALAFAQAPDTVPNLKLPITSSQFIKYYKKDNDGYAIFLDKYSKLTQLLNEQEINFPIKNESFGYDRFTQDIRYYVVGGFVQDNYLYKVIIYNGYGEADTQMLNIQLNSYDEQGKLIDALLLDSQYRYEDVSSFNQFSVNEDLTINLKQFVTYYYDEDYEYIDPKPEFYKEQVYQINQGQFKLVSSKMAEKFEWQQ